METIVFRLEDDQQQKGNENDTRNKEKQQDKKSTESISQTSVMLIEMESKEHYRSLHQKQRMIRIKNIQQSYTSKALHGKNRMSTSALE